MRSSPDERARAARLLGRIAGCRICAHALPHGPRPVVRLHPDARIAIVGQAPGVRVHTVGESFVDPSGERLRDWMGIDQATFYDPLAVAVVPAGFCFPGTDPKGADRAPRPECAPTWHSEVFALMPRLRLTIVAGWHGAKARLGVRAKRTLGETVAAWRDYAPETFVTPHPSWRTTAWAKARPWFEAELVPALRAAVAKALNA